MMRHINPSSFAPRGRVVDVSLTNHGKTLALAGLVAAFQPERLDSASDFEKAT